MSRLNYHHLLYFSVIARERGITRAAKVLHVSPSALSVQLRILEESLGHPLLERQRKGLTLTEAGRVVARYAETIFDTGNELLDVLANRPPSRRQTVRVGAVSTLSRNFQLGFLHPLLKNENVELVIRSGTLRELLPQLDAHTIDLVLSNLPIRTDTDRELNNHLLAEHPVSLVGHASFRLPRKAFPQNLEGISLVLPSRDSSIRAVFDTLLGNAGVRPRVVAEVDDMAMLRLLARETPGLTLVPSVVVRDELREGVLREVLKVPGLVETFYVITPSRRFPNPLVRRLVEGYRG